MFHVGMESIEGKILPFIDNWHIGNPITYITLSSYHLVDDNEVGLEFRPLEVRNPVNETNPFSPQIKQRLYVPWVTWCFAFSNTKIDLENQSMQLQLFSFSFLFSVTCPSPLSPLLYFFCYQIGIIFCVPIWVYLKIIKTSLIWRWVKLKSSSLVDKKSGCPSI